MVLRIDRQDSDSASDRLLCGERDRLFCREIRLNTNSARDGLFCGERGGGRDKVEQWYITDRQTG